MKGTIYYLVLKMKVISMKNINGPGQISTRADNLEKGFKTSHVEDEDSDILNDSLGVMDKKQDITRFISGEPPIKRRRHTPSRVLHNIPPKKVKKGNFGENMIIYKDVWYN